MLVFWLMGKHADDDAVVIPYKECRSKLFDEVLPFYAAAFPRPYKREVTLFEQQFVEMRCLIFEERYRTLFPATTDFARAAVADSNGILRSRYRFFSAPFQYAKMCWRYNVGITDNVQVRGLAVDVNLFSLKLRVIRKGCFIVTK
jgi:hypothetical protein